MSVVHDSYVRTDVILLLIATIALAYTCLCHEPICLCLSGMMRNTVKTMKPKPV